MMRRSATMLIGFALLCGCAGTRTPKLAKCVGPFRYANPYGTVLPSLPIPGQPPEVPTAQAEAPAAPQVQSPTTPAASSPAEPPDLAPPVAPPAPQSPTDSAKPAKTSALLPYYPSC
jgi:hypothetical protein